MRQAGLLLELQILKNRSPACRCYCVRRHAPQLHASLPYPHYGSSDNSGSKCTVFCYFNLTISCRFLVSNPCTCWNEFTPGYDMVIFQECGHRMRRTCFDRMCRYKSVTSDSCSVLCAIASQAQASLCPRSRQTCPQLTQPTVLESHPRQPRPRHPTCKSCRMTSLGSTWKVPPALLARRPETPQSCN